MKKRKLSQVSSAPTTAAMTTATLTTTTTKTTTTKRSSVVQMRQEMLTAGAHLLAYTPHREATAAQQHAWSTVQDKGLIVLESGCIIPHPYYRKKGIEGPARVRGPVAAVEALVAPGIDRRQDDTLRNEDGWPLQMEISHLCHNPACCAPGHLHVEERWKNWRRNYCGSSGQCDCRMQPACLARYRPSWWWQRHEGEWLRAVRDVAQAKATAQLSKGMCSSLVIRPRDTFASEDNKAVHRRVRRHRGRKAAASAAASKKKKQQQQG